MKFTFEGRLPVESIESVLLQQLLNASQQSGDFSHIFPDFSMRSQLWEELAAAAPKLQHSQHS